MLITKEKLKELGFSKEEIDLFKKIEVIGCIKDILQYRKEVKQGSDLYKVCYKLIAHTLERVDIVKFAIQAAELVLPIYEEGYPKEVKKRKAIEVVKVWIEDPSKDIGDTIDSGGGQQPDDEVLAAAAASIEHTLYTARLASAKEAKKIGIACFAIAAIFSAIDADDTIRDRILKFGISLLEDSLATLYKLKGC